MTTRGYKEEDFRLVGDMIYDVLSHIGDENVKKATLEKVHELNKKHPLPYEFD